MTLPKVTVILTSYNRPALLRRAAISVLEQDYEGTIELIITDDGSDSGEIDSVVAQLDLLAQKADKRELLVLNSWKSSKWRRFITDYARNINSAILASTGDIIFYLVDDDEYAENHVSLLVNELLTNKDATFVFGNQLTRYLNAETMEHADAFERVYTEHVLESAPNNIDHNQFAHWAAAIEKVGLWPEDKVHYGACDGAFFDQVHRAGFVFYNATMPNEEGDVYLTSIHYFHEKSVQPS